MRVVVRTVGGLLLFGAFLSGASLATAQSNAAVTTLWFVGDGSATDFVTATVGTESTWAMSPDGPGAEPTSFQQIGNQHDANDPADGGLPTFLWPEPVTIDAQAPVLVRIFVEDPWGGVCGGMDGQLFDAAGTVLGPADKLIVDTVGGPGTIEELLFSFEGIAGDFVGLQFRIGGHWTDCSSLPYTFHWGSAEHPARLEYLGPPASGGSEPSGPALGNLTGPVATVRHSFTNATSATYQYAWSTDLTAARLDYSATIATGNATVVVLDASNQRLADFTVAANATEAIDLNGASPGNWSIQITYAIFTGQLDLSIKAMPASGSTSGSASSSQSGTGTTSATTESSSGTGSSGTSTTSTKKDKGSPGLEPVALLGLLALSAVVERRRFR